ncbi:MAG: hypothetical protein AB7G21_02750 [Dehalococcoidia bacterium]
MAEAHTLAVTGLVDQSELFAFASALEAQPHIGGIGLVRADGATGVFSVLTPSREALVEACGHVPGFAVTVQASAPGWEVVELTVAREAPPEPTPFPGGRVRSRSTLLSDDMTLPRSRLPVFGRRPAEDASTGESDAAAPTEETLHWDVLDDAIEAVLSEEPPPRGTEPLPWPPVEVDVYAPTLTVQVAEREQVRLVASPLRSFGQVNAFRDRLAALEGVIGLTVGRFYRGALQLTVEYADVVPLASRLRDLPEFAPRTMRQPDAGTIEITFR